MTAQEWVKKRGIYLEDDTLLDEDGNTVETMGGNLENMACECGARDQFRIEVTVLADVDDESIDPETPDYSCFDKSSYCRCCSCEEDGKVGDFTVPGLDKLLRQIQDGEVEEDEPSPPPIPLNSLPFNKVSESETQPPQTIGWDTSNIKQ